MKTLKCGPPAGNAPEQRSPLWGLAGIRPSATPAVAARPLDLTAAVAPTAQAAAAAGIAAVSDPLPESAGAAAAEAAALSVARRTGLHVLDHLPVVSGSCDRSHTV